MGTERIINIKVSHVGEIAKIEEIAKHFITPKMNGLDIGSGGMPILVQSVSVDYCFPGQYSELVNLKGNAKNLYWFKDNCMDYVFSSHCFEDFPIEEKRAVFEEWLRVIKPGGLMLLYLPDEKLYREWCSSHNLSRNMDHKDETFNINTMREIAKNSRAEEVFYLDAHGDYCFFIVFRKRK